MKSRLKMIRILVSKQILFENANKLKPQTILSEIQNADDNQIQSRAIKMKIQNSQI